MPIIEKRYAEALINISGYGTELDNMQKEFSSVIKVYGNKELKFFLHNPKVRIEIKKDTFKKIFDKKINIYLLNFLMLLLDKDRIKLLPNIFNEFIKFADKKRNTLSMKIITASPLDETQVNEIKEKYKKIYSASNVNAIIEIQKDLLGGIKIQIGDKVTDGSIKGVLEGLMGVLGK